MLTIIYTTTVTLRDLFFFCFFFFVIYLIFKVLLLLSIKYIILELKTYTKKIVKYNNYVNTTKSLGTIRIKDEDLPIYIKIYLYIYKDALVMTI